ncbi:MAG: hypothetical protein V2B19_03350 [Pseudomonadota bacterium]
MTKANLETRRTRRDDIDEDKITRFLAFAGYLLESLNLSRFKTGASVPTLDRNSFKTLPILDPP